MQSLTTANGWGAQHEISIALGRQVHSPIRRVQALVLRSGHAALGSWGVPHASHRPKCLAQIALFQGLEAVSYLLGRPVPTHLTKRLARWKRASGCQCFGLAQ